MSGVGKPGEITLHLLAGYGLEPHYGLVLASGFAEAKAHEVLELPNLAGVALCTQLARHSWCQIPIRDSLKLVDSDKAR